MTLRLSPEILRAAYDFLRATPPFKRWKLPPPEFVEFSVNKAADTHGDYVLSANGTHRIRLSETLIGHTASLMCVMAHEMIHLHQAEAGTLRPKAHHGAEFKRLAARVCKLHGFDPKAF
jgi:predicted SprT family Zn-dependent metalloprotease